MEAGHSQIRNPLNEERLVHYEDGPFVLEFGG